MKNLDLKIMYVIALIMGLWMNAATATENKTSPLTSAQLWSIGFGSDLKQQIQEMKQIHEKRWGHGGTNTWRLKNMIEDFKYQQRMKSHAGKQQWQRNKEQLSTIAKALGSMFKGRDNDR